MRDVKDNLTQTDPPTVPKFGAYPPTAAKPFGDKADVQAMLLCCRRSVDGYMADGMPHLKLGPRKVLFDLDEVREWAKRKFATRRNGPANGGPNV